MQPYKISSKYYSFFGHFQCKSLSLKVSAKEIFIEDRVIRRRCGSGVVTVWNLSLESLVICHGVKATFRDYLSLGLN